MTKHWAHRPHPLGQHFVLQENSIYLGFCPIPSISLHHLSPAHPTPHLTSPSSAAIEDFEYSLLTCRTDMQPIPPFACPH